ncbi:MAG: type II toxin-antitoxin system VapC family toxin [Planctomycetes bacterium]|nr:type II toxin-antitoxin system VapC family toxin [Planctomycetota bacterium]
MVEATQRVVELAGDLCDLHKLRGMDAIHLASAKLLAQEAEVAVRISTSAPRLREAPVAEGMA